MQVFSSTLDKAGRPCALRDCALCEGLCKLHRHGNYLRYEHPEGGTQVTVPRFLCPRCRRTWSVIPPNMFPYRSLPVTRFEGLLDEQSGLTGGGARPPPATQIETGCVRRAVKKLSERIPFLCGLLGQQVPLAQGPGIHWFWRALRELGPTQGILADLARDFKTSLLACYVSLKSPWHRARAPA
ncbi:MAG: hypothetical protein O3A87_12005 [Verrucomicrobia bacterium]|nr:hypothetical protein [Verrucomicrobiota bacterium]MDA1007187.1 hypothetical protein [Verrucomicrobiota bacterium]